MILGTKELKEPKVSLIITYFNLGNYITDCVSSILGQGYQNFEIIIVNDNSDEKNSKILEEIKNPKIKIINLKENKGQLLAFLEGLKVASGEFVCMVDADDILLKEYLKTLLFIHQTNKAAFVSSNYGEINEKNEVVFLKNSKNLSLISFEDILFILVLLKISVSRYSRKKECALAHSRACGGRLRHLHCTPQCASSRSVFYFTGKQFPVK
mgnify:CR=1 FL=1